MKRIYKHYLLIILCCSILSSLGTHAQGWQWEQNSLCNDYYSDMGLVVVDKMNNCLYIAGDNQGDSICLPPFTVHNLLGADSLQTYIAKYDTAGNVLWAIGSGNGQSSPLRITVDANGYLYVLGRFFSPVITFGGHTIVNSSYDYINYWTNMPYYLVKLDANGNVIWAKCGANATSIYDLCGGGIATDPLGNIYITQSFKDSTINIGGHVLVNAMKDSNDIFIAKYDTAGNVLWAKSFGNVSDDRSMGIVVSNDYSVYLSGWFESSSIAFGSTILTHNGVPAFGSGWRPNTFLVKLDTSGNVLWGQSSSGCAYGLNMAIDNANDVYIGGGLIDSYFVAFSTDTLKDRQLLYSAFVTKYDVLGNVVWAKGIYPINTGGSTGGGKDNLLFGITVDPCNNVWVCGRMNIFSAGTTIDSGVILYPPPGITSANDPLFIIGYTSSGGLLQYQSLMSGGDDEAALASDLKGNIYLSSDYRTTMPLGTLTLPNVGTGSENMFIAKYNPNLGCVSAAISPIEGHTSFCLELAADTLSDATTGGIWSSSNTSIAIVGTSSGIVTGVSLGVVRITYTIGARYVTFLDTVKPCEGGVYMFISHSSQIVISPNPATTSLTITSGENIKTVAITNLLGRPIYTHQYNTTKAEVDVAGLPTGMYLIRINGTDVRKFVKE